VNVASVNVASLEIASMETASVETAIVEIARSRPFDGEGLRVQHTQSAETDSAAHGKGV